MYGRLFETDRDYRSGSISLRLQVVDGGSEDCLYSGSFLDDWRKPLQSIYAAFSS